MLTFNFIKIILCLKNNFYDFIKSETIKIYLFFVNIRISVNFSGRWIYKVYMCVLICLCARNTTVALVVPFLVQLYIFFQYGHYFRKYIISKLWYANKCAPCNSCSNICSKRKTKNDFHCT